MPAMMDDPDTPTIYRVSGDPPYPDPTKPPALTPELVPRQVLLRDRQTAATVLPFVSQHQVPPSLLRYLADQLNKEIEGGDTYPMTEPMSYERFASYWFQNFGAVMLLGNIERPEDIASLPEAAADNMSGTSTTTTTTTSEAGDWSKRCLGSFYIKPNYPGRSSHVCNAGFLVTDAARNRGAGRLMGESYLDWAPKLGYTYSVFNLVYETNVVSCKIWDALGFKRIGRVKGCGNLRSYPGRLVDAIIYGRDLVPGEFPEDLKSRLRSAATHYKLLENDRLMLKDKEVVPDPRRQYKIARQVHEAQHGGINKTTATIAEKYHWSRIKETVSDVIRNCAECKELGKMMPAPGGGNGAAAARARASTGVGGGVGVGTSGGAGARSNGSPSIATGTTVSTVRPNRKRSSMSAAAVSVHAGPPLPYSYPSPEAVAGGIAPTDALHDPSASPLARHRGLSHHNPMLQDSSHGLPRDHTHHHHHRASHDPHSDSVYQPIDPQMINNPHHHPADPYGPYHTHPHPHPHEPPTETDFQALLTATTSDPSHHHHHDHDPNHNHAHSHPHGHTPGPPDMVAEADAAAREAEAVDRDLDMLIQPDDDDEVQHAHDEDQDETMAGIGHDHAAALAVSDSAPVPPAEEQVQVHHISNAETQVETIGPGVAPGDADPGGRRMSEQEDRKGEPNDGAVDAG
ncbi:hypothetical protein ACRALDRAFT_2061538 [Sodiomyces alcalophilus JCM 7366]|uniref:uncharacterized protein n=1 Tax=Sodiomyces alcalophilus JCM 7366 TaxID=591952 RepID=UPI0039B5A097